MVSFSYLNAPRNDLSNFPCSKTTNKRYGGSLVEILFWPALPSGCLPSQGKVREFTLPWKSQGI